MKPEDFDYAHNQYYLALINDGAVYSKLQNRLREDTFQSYAQSVATEVEKLRVRHKLDELDIEGKVYVRLMVAEYLLTPFELQSIFKGGDEVARKHIDFCIRNNMTWLIDRLLGLPVVKPQSPTQPQATQENTMASIEIKTITYINDADVTKLSDEQLIDAIKKIESEIADLGAVKTESAKIKAKIDNLHETLAKVVAILDAR